MKLTLMDTIEVLLNDGSISVKENRSTTTREIRVNKPHPLIKGATQPIGTIDAKTLATLLRTDYIKPLPGIKTDKYGNMCWFYETNIQTINKPQG